MSIPSPAENLLLTSDVLNCVFVSVDAIVTAPPDSVIVTFEPAVNANVSPLAKVLPPAVIALGAVKYEPVAEFSDVFNTSSSKYALSITEPFQVPVAIVPNVVTFVLH